MNAILTQPAQSCNRRSALQLSQDSRAFAKAKHRDFGFAVARIASVEAATGRRVDYVLEADDDSHDILADLVAYHTNFIFGREHGEDGEFHTFELDGRVQFTLDWTDCEEVIDGPISVSMDRSDIDLKARVVLSEVVAGHQLITVEVEGRLECDPPVRRRGRGMGFWEMEA